MADAVNAAMAALTQLRMETEAESTAPDLNFWHDHHREMAAKLGVSYEHLHELATTAAGLACETLELDQEDEQDIETYTLMVGGFEQMFMAGVLHAQ